MCLFLATALGDFALFYAAFGGVYLGGGVADALVPLLDQAAFRARFESKGRFGSYVSRIPVLHIRRPDTALLGTAAYTF